MLLAAQPPTSPTPSAMIHLMFDSSLCLDPPKSPGTCSLSNYRVYRELFSPSQPPEGVTLVSGIGERGRPSRLFAFQSSRGTRGNPPPQQALPGPRRTLQRQAG